MLLLKKPGHRVKVTMEEIIAERKFVIEASRERVLSLIGKVILRSMHGIERVQVLDESHFTFRLPVKVAFISLFMYLKGEVIADASHPESLAVLLKARTKGGIIQLNQRVIFTIASVNEGKTEVACKSMVEGMPILLRIFFLGKVKSLAEEAVNGMERYLKQWA